MNRREFCKRAALAALVGALMPERVLAGERMLPTGISRIDVTVIRCMAIDDLQSRYADDPETGACKVFTPGERFSIDSDGNALTTKKICPLALRTILSAVDSERCLKSSQLIVSCPDGLRPVLFKVELR